MGARKKKTRPSGKRVARELSLAKVNRKRLAITTLAAPAGDVAYWRTRSPQERLQHVEFLRLLNYGQAAVSGRLKRVFEVAQLKTR